MAITRSNWSRCPSSHVERLLQGVAKLDLRVQDVVEDQVHLGDGDHRAVAVLAVEHQVAAVAPLLVHVLAGLDQHAAGAGSGVVDAHALGRLENLHHQAHDLAGRVELAALLAGAVGEVLDQVFVGRAQQVGKLEVVVDQHKLGLVEVVDQVFELGVGDLALVVDGGVEVDVAQHALQDFVLQLQLLQRLVEPGADVVVQVLERGLALAVLVDDSPRSSGRTWARRRCRRR